MPSFDIVCELNMSEVDNALAQANKELAQRFDFRGSDTKVVREKNVITLESADDYKVKAGYEVLISKLVKRSVSLKSLKAKDIEPAAKGRARQAIDLIEGIDIDNAKDLVKKIKDAKLKVQASIQENQVRISGKQKDDLQTVMTMVRALEFPLPLNFNNFRD